MNSEHWGDTLGMVLLAAVVGSMVARGTGLVIAALVVIVVHLALTRIASAHQPTLQQTSETNEAPVVCAKCGFAGDRVRHWLMSDTNSHGTHFECEIAALKAALAASEAEVARLSQDAARWESFSRWAHISANGDGEVFLAVYLTGDVNKVCGATEDELRGLRGASEEDELDIGIIDSAARISAIWDATMHATKQRQAEFGGAGGAK